MSTPGNWYKRQRKDKDYNIYSGGTDVALCVRPKDADVIAAAPEMLEALKNIENDDKHMPPTIWKAIQDAIRKAEGD